MFQPWGLACWDPAAGCGESPAQEGLPVQTSLRETHERPQAFGPGSAAASPGSGLTFALYPPCQLRGSAPPS